MVVKIGLLRSAREASLARSADIVGVRLASEAEAGDRTISEETLASIRGATSAKVSLHIDPLNVDRDLVRRCAPDFVEFVVADPEKTLLLDRQLEAIAELGLPFIVKGLYLSRDDLWLLKQTGHLDRLLTAGACYLEVELESIMDAGFRIGAAARRQAHDLFHSRSVLISDNFTSLSEPFGIGESGVVLVLGADRHRPQSFAFPTAVRLLRTSGPRSGE